MKTQVSEDFLNAIKRKRGERNLTFSKLANEVGVSRLTVYRLFNKNQKVVYPTTKEKLIEWLSKNS
ncbi:Hypothetical protein ADU72_1703 [Pediococcus damnosus]|uniref:HTH cro/C1-type domain-containing protein n=1 Tax=Pediococcus damnosus TaxID=51663 RepID=A0ABM6A5F9_9LACO|nr:MULTISPECIES: TetR/AcrR family transcriptional regulator [Pediococcus]AMV67628.1 Hypothetical protein ADU72_1703 [Pediococcus damnosus]MBU7563053.1 TetR/AcrR family transcriptional regulator [Pediococcus ethanolidurans]MCT3034846.1 TetR/AcrR family transcriptional regulator [Pediococcus parvulus]MCV3322703.1 TetR/AcrR family transcriptional regulator [Pediococcus ethanolidurans]PIO80866.1 transcriptional regulator [Pediococcus damnosus]